MKTAILTDSSAYLSTEDIKRYNIHVIPISVVFGNESYREGIDIDNAEFYRKLNVSKKLPTTSQPPIGELIETYNQLADEGYDTVISIHLASTISGLLSQVANVATMLDNIRVIPFDSEITVALMGDLVKYAAALANIGTNPDEIIKKLEEQRSTINELMVVDDINNLVKGGRLSNATAFIGGLLNIKPILTFDNQTDEIVAFDKVRSMKRALKRVESIVTDDLKNIDYKVKFFVIDANDRKAGDTWVKSIHEKFPNIKIEQGYFGPSIGAHLGEKALALGWEKDINFDEIK